MGEHRFYHVDRYKSLKEGQVIILDDRGLSYFGTTYWDAIQSKPFESMNDAEQREYLLEKIKCEPYLNLYNSRMQAFFGVNTLEDARRFAERLEPKQMEKIPIFEVFASKFWNLDMNWLDYITEKNLQRRIDHLRNYWHAQISNHNPTDGDRNPPHIEVLMALPVTIGKVAEWV